MTKTTTKPQAAELLPCPNPWCANSEGVSASVHTTTGKWHVCCDDCMIEGPWADRHAAAIAAWNTRALMAQPTVAADVQEAVSRACYFMSEPHLSGHRLIIGFETNVDAGAAHQALAMLQRESGAGSSSPITVATKPQAADVRAFKPGDRVRHVRSGELGNIVETHYPGWVDWRPDDYAGPVDGAMRTDPSNLALASQPTPSAVGEDVRKLVADLRARLDSQDWAHGWDHNIVPPGKPAHELACAAIRALPKLLDALTTTASSPINGEAELVATGDFSDGLDPWEIDEQGEKALGLLRWHWREKQPLNDSAYNEIRIAIPTAALAAPAPPLDALITPKMLGEVMQDAWGEICDDAGAHPLDIQRVKGVTWYGANHWTDLIALRLNERLAALAQPQAIDAGKRAYEYYQASTCACTAAEQYVPTCPKHGNATPADALSDGGVPKDMKTWHGGDGPPADWNEWCRVAFRDGTNRLLLARELSYAWKWSEKPAWYDIVAYQPLSDGGGE